MNDVFWIFKNLKISILWMQSNVISFLQFTTSWVNNGKICSAHLKRSKVNSSKMSIKSPIKNDKIDVMHTNFWSTLSPKICSRIRLLVKITFKCPELNFVILNLRLFLNNTIILGDLNTNLSWMKLGTHVNHSIYW